MKQGYHIEVARALRHSPSSVVYRQGVGTIICEHCELQGTIRLGTTNPFEGEIFDEPCSMAVSVNEVEATEEVA